MKFSGTSVLVDSVQQNRWRRAGIVAVSSTGTWLNGWLLEFVECQYGATAQSAAEILIGAWLTYKQARMSSRTNPA